MNVIVFLGPTLPRDAARSLLEATYLPPASQGDVYRAARTSPFAIGLIDGYFDALPAVWHKEILWAMAQGVHVFGASSMGALRAAELDSYGMIGVGQVYASLRAGELEDDDEVAIVHGDASTGYRGLSEAMVNIRSTLRVARESGAIGQDAHDALVMLAKSTFYPERGYPGLLSAAGQAGISPHELSRLRDFLPSGRVDVKSADARALLSTMSACCARDEKPAPVKYRFASTDRWERLVEWAETQAPLVAEVFET
jgi:hypothetical protein